MSQKPRVLVVEDDEQLGRMLSTMLRDVAEVIHARDGRDALTWLGLNPAPHAILTDRAMPHLDGLELVRALKRDERWSSIPVLMLTAQGGSRGMVDAINAGVRHYVTKPFKTIDLVSKIQKMLTTPRSRANTWRAPALATPVDDDDVELLDVEVLDVEVLEVDDAALQLRQG